MDDTPSPTTTIPTDKFPEDVSHEITRCVVCLTLFARQKQLDQVSFNDSPRTKKLIEGLINGASEAYGRLRELAPKENIEFQKIDTAVIDGIEAEIAKEVEKCREPMLSDIKELRVRWGLIPALI